MNYSDAFRDSELAPGLLQAIAAEATRPSYRFMEFCGGHTQAIARHGLAELLPPALTLIHGPGCPVCVLPIERIDQAIRLALVHGVVLCAYGDTLRVPASGGLSLLKARARGADVRVVYAVSDALRIARAEPDRDVVFFAVGFEATTTPTALALIAAQRDELKNFSVLCNHVLTPAAIEHMLRRPAAGAAGADGTAGEGTRLDGFIGPGHVSAVIGSIAYEACAQRHRKAVVIAGFEPLDILYAIWRLVRQVNRERCEVENAYRRAVSREGNLKARALVAAVFELRESFAWRGLGRLPRSALKIRRAFAPFDAEARYRLDCPPVADPPACACAAILCGLKTPDACKLFATHCSPENPIGACMVSPEGACAAHYAYRRQPPGPALARREEAPCHAPT